MSKQVHVNIPSFKLNNGIEMPVIAFGTWLGMSKKYELYISELPRMLEALKYAIDIGYRHINTAHFYRVEPEIGDIINMKISAGVIRREDMFVTTKVWHHFHREADVEVSLRGSLRRLKLDYVDQLLIHWPMSISKDGVDEKIDYLETWRGMEAVLDKGLTKSIGVSNFNLEQMKRLIENCKVKPATNQVEINLNLGQPELVEYCQANDVVMVASNPLGSMVPGHAALDSPPPKLNDPTMLKISRKYGKTVTQVALRYLYQRDIITVPKTTKKRRVLENASIFDFDLDQEDVKNLATFDNGYRSFIPVFWQDYENYPLPREPKLEEWDMPKSLLEWKNGANLDIE